MGELFSGLALWLLVGILAHLLWTAWNDNE